MQPINPSLNLSAEDFLARFGIKQTDPASSSNEPEMHEDEFESELSFDPMSAEAMNFAFESEHAAVNTLSGNADRLVWSMERVKKAIEGINNHPSQFAELGGGTGIISLWLAKQNPQQSYHVFDHAKFPLAIGKKWATQLGVENIEFHHASYSQIRNGSFSKLNFVFAEHAVVLEFPEQLSNDEETATVHSFFHTRMDELCGAVSVLVANEGNGFIGSGIPDPWALDRLCECLRNNRLSIDWSRTSNAKGLKLMVQHGSEPILDHFGDDSLALIAGMGKVRRLNPHEVRPFEMLFRDGRKILLAAINSPDEGRTTLRLLQKGGYLLKIKRFENGADIGFLVPAGNLFAEAEKCMRLKRGESMLYFEADPRLKLSEPITDPTPF